MSDHLDRLTILEFVEGADDIDRVAVATHLGACEECRGMWEELQGLLLLLGDGSIFNVVADEEAETDRDLIWNDLATGQDRAERDAFAADAFYTELAKEPIEAWDGMLANQPQHCTAAMVQRIVQAVEPELDRKPEHALALLRFAELVAFALLDDESGLHLGHVWKQRSNALRQLARYEEAVDAAILAEGFYASLRNGEFDVGQAQYTLAVALFKMTRYGPALQALARSRTTLEEYGITAPLAKTMMLDALIRVEQGDIATARETLRELLPIEEGLGQRLEAARVRANLAECNLRLGDLENAMTDARAAIEAYRALGNDVEELRASWTVAMIRIARREEAALDQLHEIAAAFQALAMSGDAGFVQLDITEEHLRRGDWIEAEVIARGLVTLFAAAGVTIASVGALDFLRQAVENREATAAIVRYVREYLTADDPSRPFEPPHESLN